MRRKGFVSPGSKGPNSREHAEIQASGLHYVEQAFGYDVIICLADTQSPEKKGSSTASRLHKYWRFLQYHSATQIITSVATKRLADVVQKSGSYDKVFYANQWDNLSNRQAHIDSTGPEIWQQLDGKLDAFSCAAGTGGTITGVGTFLRGMDKNIKVALTDPEGAALIRYYTEGKLRSVGSSISEGIGQGRITGNMASDDFRPDVFFEISDQEMIPILQSLQQNEGLAIGGSAGVNVASAIRRLPRSLGRGIL